MTTIVNRSDRHRGCLLTPEFNLHYGFGELVLKYLDELARIVQEKMESINSRARKEDM